MRGRLAMRGLHVWITGWLGATLAAPAQSEELMLQRLHIESNPSGAEVLLIGGSVGRTPLTVGERDIYPNDYPDDRAHLYGMVRLRRDGCDPVTHRVTLDDIADGLVLDLDCVDQNGSAGHQAPPNDAASPASAVDASIGASGNATTASKSRVADRAAVTTAASASERRLRQLQVLQELLDEGLIDAAEDRRIRRRVLTAPSPSQ